MTADDTARTQVLDAADALFYAHGIRAVGMDRIRDASGVSLKRLYRYFSSKDELVAEYLRRRDRVARQALREHVETHTTTRDRLLSVFDWLYDWFSEAGFRGCAFTNAFSEVGAENQAAATAVRAHQQAFHDYLRELAAPLPDPDDIADQFLVLIAGAINTALIRGNPKPARHARTAAAALLEAATTPDPEPKRPAR